MNTSTIIAVVAVIVVLVVVVLAVRPLLRRRRLQERFGPEYDRAVETHGDRSKAERELVERERRYKELDLRPLSREACDSYHRQWTDVQARFVDAPEATVAEADRLVTQVMADRGYPTEGYEQQLADLSVEHSTTLEHYRTAHDVQERSAAGQASTEDLRNAMVRYRALFQELLVTDEDDRTDRDGVDRDRMAGVDADRAATDRGDGYDRDGLDRAGYDRAGYDRDGYDRDGLDRDGYDRDRLDRAGVDRSRAGYEADRTDGGRANDVYADRGDGVVHDADGRDGDLSADADLPDAERRRHRTAH